MGSSLKPYCQSCQKEYSTLLIGSGFLTHPRQRVPSYCRTCNKISSVYLDEPFCEVCHDDVEVLGDFQCSKEFEESKPLQIAIMLFDDFFAQNKLGIRKETLIKEAGIIQDKPNWLGFKKKPKDNLNFYLVINFNKKYLCPQCRNIELQLKYGDIKWG